MNVTVSASALLRELQAIQPIVAGKAIIPILTQVLISADEAGLTLSATDTELGLVTSCLATVGEKGVTALPAEKLHAIVKSLPSETVLTLARPRTGSGILLSGGQYKVLLPEMSPEDFPQLKSPEGPVRSIPTALLTRALLPRFVVSETTPGMPYAAGVLIVVAGGKIETVATDGRRLATVASPFAADELPAAIVPRKTIWALADLTEEADPDSLVAYTVGETLLFFQLGGRLLISRMIDAQFPNWRRFVPSPSGTTTFGRSELQEAMQRVGLVCSTNRRVDWKIGAGTLALSAQSPEYGAADERISAEHAGPDLATAFHGPFVQEFLRATGSDRVAFSQQDARTGALFSPSDDPDFRYVLMPIV